MLPHWLCLATLFSKNCMMKTILEIFLIVTPKYVYIQSLLNMI